MAALAWVAAGLAVPALVVEVLEAGAWVLGSAGVVSASEAVGLEVAASVQELGAAGSAWAAVEWVVRELVAEAWAVAELELVSAEGAPALVAEELGAQVLVVVVLPKVSTFSPVSV